MNNKKQPQKTDPLGWIGAIFFPKKSGPPATQATAPSASSAPTAAAETKYQYRPALWTIASILSLIVNVILIIVLLVVVILIVPIRNLVADHLLGGLYNNFVAMDQAHIKTNISVEDNIPVQFTLPVKTNTTVVLTEATYIEGALVTLNTGGLYITNAPANIVLPAGTSLPVALDITVPVNTTIPIKINVPVDIALDQTDLHAPFVGLKGVVEPFYLLFYPPQNAQP